MVGTDRFGLGLLMQFRSSRVAFLAVVVAVLSGVLAGCSGGDDEVATDGDGVRTVDAAEASGRRSAGVDDSESLDRIDSDSPEAEAAADAATSIADIPAASDDTDETPPAVEYPAIVEPIDPAPEGVKALLTSSGVLLGVTGVVPEGYVVLTPCGGRTIFNGGQIVGPTQIVIDPGHGGDEAGASDVPDLTEAQLNLALAQATAAELDRRGISVVLTRDGDYRIPIRVRAQLTDLISPQAMISIHHNTPASRASEEPGTEVYVQTGSEQSRRLGELVYASVFDALNQFDIAWTSRDDAGVLTVVNDAGEDAYGIARYPSTPSALVEMAYLGNEAEAAFLATPEYLTSASLALADGIERFLSTSESGRGFVETPRVFNPSGATGGAGGCTDPVLD